MGFYLPFQQFYNCMTAAIFIGGGKRNIRKTTASHWQTLKHKFVSSTFCVARRNQLKTSCVFVVDYLKYVSQQKYTPYTHNNYIYSGCEISLFCTMYAW
jgi:hypothetical protein